MPWQWLLMWRLFGICNPDGYRQYRTAYLEIPKKNGKSELAAAVALILLCADDEYGAEVYSAAADKNQAGLVFDVAAQMVRNSPKLKKRLKIIDSRKRVVDYKTGSFYQVLSAEVYTKHGLNPHGVIFDEIHAQPSRDLWAVLTEGTDYARTQQMVFALTTAGIYDKESVGWEVHERARQVDAGIVKDDTFLPIMYCADKDKDDPADSKVWKRVNPSIGHIFNLAKIKADWADVEQFPRRYNDFLRFRLNIWVNQLDRWINMDQFDACRGEIDRGTLLKRPAFGGLDLAQTMDLTAFALAFPPLEKGEKWKLLVKCYVPEDAIKERSDRDRVPYLMWRDAGYLTATPGNITDYEWIRNDVLNAFKLYDLREVAYDPYNATQLAVKLDNEDGIPMVQHRQGFLSMNEPCKGFEAKIVGGELLHDGNPVLRWCVDNLAMKLDPAGNIKPDKSKARERIDAATAVIMALGRAIVAYEDNFVYNQRGLLQL
jgi:phage terminase large subunit-like protein